MRYLMVMSTFKKSKSEYEELKSKVVFEQDSEEET